MCFYHDDYDWSASVCNVTESESGPAVKCDECGSPIGENQYRKHIYMQEYEGCKICEDDCSDSFIDRETADADELKILDEHAHNYGETYEYNCCRACENFLIAIEAREKEEGCPVDERRPMLGELIESMHEHEQAREYGLKAIEMFPELATHRPVMVAMGSDD